MKGCRTIKQAILRAVDGDLPLAESLSLDAHLEACSSCRAYRAELLSLNELAGLLPEPALERLDVQAAARAIQGELAEQAAVAPGTPLEHAAWDKPLGSGPSRGWRLGVGLVALAAAALLLVQVPWFGATSEVESLEPGSKTTDALASGMAPAGQTSFDRGQDAAPRGAALVAGEVGSDTSAPGKSIQLSEPGPLTRQRVERDLRVALLAAFTQPGGALIQRDALERFDQGLTGAHMRWPLASMAERMLAQEDTQLARAAARYLGLRGSRLSVASLRAGLQRPGVAPACVLALGDLGELGFEALSTALSNKELRVSALDRLALSRDARAAELIGDSLLREARDAEARALHLSALGLLGPAALPTLMRLADRPRLSADQVIDALGLIDGAGAELARHVQVQPRRWNAGLLLRVVDRLEALEMLPWLETQMVDFGTREQALASLTRLPGTLPVASLLRLDQRGLLGEEELGAAMGALSAAGPERMQRFAEELVEGSDALRAGQYLNLLISGAEPGGAGALALLAISDLLTLDERQWAALAVGELGGEAEALMLRDALAANEFSDRRLVAACLITVFHSLGEEGVFGALDSYPLDAVNEVFKVLVDSSADPHQSHGAVQLFGVARALNLAHLSRNPRIGQSSL